MQGIACTGRHNTTVQGTSKKNINIQVPQGIGKQYNHAGHE
jgi:hypothetical protein